jgi:signal transduction histidine kinase
VRGRIRSASQPADSARRLVGQRDILDPEPWGEDPKLVELLGAQGAAQFRALLDGFPEAVGVLWAVRDDDGRIVDFTFGYGNPSMLRSFRVPLASRDRLQRRMEAELRSYADVVAHDLSEPIAGIELLVRLLQRRAEEPPSADVLRQLRASTERARDLIDGVLVYARAGELSVERVELGRLAADVAEDLGPSVEAAGATLEIRELPEVDGDPRQLRRVLQNLVGNALKFRSSEAPPRVELSALRDSHEWVVTVRDNGVGVDPDQASRIFEMFSRANSEAEGVGIGLAVCRRIIEAHGGRIWVEAADGGGSAFRFTMPR